MTGRKFIKLSPTEISPAGLLRRQLELQARGLTGCIRFLWDDLSDNSAWLGGLGESWERGPYYLDGLIPLGFLLDEPELKAEAVRWVESILSSQQASGFFGPAWNADWWPRTVVLKALVPYYMATRDDRIIPFMDRYLEYQYRNLDGKPPFFWASARALEAAEAIELVYSQTGKAYLIELCRKLAVGMYDWFSYFEDLPYKKPAGEYMNRFLFNAAKAIVTPLDTLLKKSRTIKKPRTAAQTTAFNQRKLTKTISMTHGVNIAMALKYPSAIDSLTGCDEHSGLALKGYGQLLKYHGTAIGLWTSDEHLNGPSPAGGTELCTVVEAMYSMEELLSIDGDPAYADALEFLAYNALPATMTDDMRAHQYVQQVNQVAADRKRRSFFDAGIEANTFGLAPNYGCCAANLHQGFPKFAACACFKSADGLAFLVYAPCTVSTEIAAGRKVSIAEETDYPFGDSIRFRVLVADGQPFAMTFRVPALTSMVILYNGVSQGRYSPGLARLEKAFAPGDVIDLELETPLTAVRQADGGVAFRKGSLLMALKISERCRPYRGKPPFHYREFLPESDWNLAPSLSGGNAQVLETIRREVPGMPFAAESPALELLVKGVKILNWKTVKNSAGPYPAIPELSGPLVLSLVPYGCTNIRVAQFPFLENA